MTTYQDLCGVMENNPNIFLGLDEDRELKFREWLPENMRVYNAFVNFALELKRNARRDYYSARAIWERLRWQSLIEDTDPDFKLSDSSMPFVSWLSMEAEPEMEDMFQKRLAKSMQKEQLKIEAARLLEQYN
tara:strand:+ start:178 stop:573 length:396 start_codon:yes stop_codon:yes gene_type:complete